MTSPLALPTLIAPTVVPPTSTSPTLAAATLASPTSTLPALAAAAFAAGLAGLAAFAGLSASSALSPAAAADKPVLTVYTYDGFPSKYGPGGVIKERFEATCGCTLEWVTADDGGTLLARLKLEGDATQADVVLGLDTNLMGEAEASGLFAEHGITPTGLTIPVEWTSKSFLPFDWGWFAFVYDADKLKAPPKSLAELVDGEGGPTLLIQDPRTSTPGLGLLLWLREVYGDKSDEAWAKLKPKIVTVTKGWSEAYGMFLEGEADMVLSYTTSPAYHAVAEGKQNYRAAIFPEGHYVQIEVAGITKAADDPELARKFMAFMISDGFQSAIPEGNWMYPAAIAPDKLPASFAALPKPAKSFLLEPAVVRDNRRAWIDAWLAAYGG
jgi:thiamine transport system substrate-binding protein